jgi:Lysylphosphatidylglycerol synthase TM region
MRDAAHGLVAGLERATTGLAEAVAGAALGWLVVGVVLHLANQVARGRGWYPLVRAACPAAAGPGRREVIEAWVAGAGAGGVLSARGGDAVRVLLLARRAPGGGCPVLAGTLVAEGAGELAFGAALLAVAVAVGVGPDLAGPAAAAPWALAAAALAAAGGVAMARRVPAARRLAGRVGRGCAAIGGPGPYLRRVAPWQLASRLCRAAALACFLTAFGLPATPAAVLLVMFAQAGGRVMPFAPAAVGAGVAVLAAAFGPVTGAAVPAGQVAAFLIGTSTVLTLVGVPLAAALVLRGLDTRAPAAALGAVRTAVRPPRRARRGAASA